MVEAIKDLFNKTVPYYVYVISPGKMEWQGLPFLKIGVTRDITRRLQELQPLCPAKLEVIRLVGPMRRNDAFQLEASLKQDLKAHRTNGGGEWYNVPLADVVDPIDVMIAVVKGDTTNPKAAQIIGMLNEGKAR